MKYLKYLKYVFVHKWYVAIECMKVGAFWSAKTHDLSKFRPSEFFPYVEHFYGEDKKEYSDFHEPGEDIVFDTAWLKHIHRNPHHWQYWVLKEDSGEVKTIPMTNRYRKEMLCDWRGAGKAQGKGDNTVGWYKENKDKMILHPDTRQWIEDQLGI